MSEIAIYQSLLQLFSSIDSCLEQKVQLPTLILVYAGIDSLGWMFAQDPASKVGERFASWVDQYLLPGSSLRCTALDLYSARCGLLHSLTGDSDLIAKGRARPLMCAWGNADASKLQEALNREYPEKCVAIHIRDLASAMYSGALRMFDDAKEAECLGRCLRDRGDRFFVGMNSDFSASTLPSGIPSAPCDRASLYLRRLSVSGTGVFPMHSIGGVPRGKSPICRSAYTIRGV